MDLIAPGAGSVPDCRPDAEGPARKTDLNWPGDRGIHPAKAGSRRAMPAVDVPRWHRGTPGGAGPADGRRSSVSGHRLDARLGLN